MVFTRLQIRTEVGNDQLDRVAIRMLGPFDSHLGKWHPEIQMRERIPCIGVEVPILRKSRSSLTSHPSSSTRRLREFPLYLIQSILNLVWEAQWFNLSNSVTRCGEILPLWQRFLMVYFLFSQMICLLWRICDIIGLIFIVANGRTLKII